MLVLRSVILAMIASLALSACGKKEEDKKAAPAAPAPQTSNDKPTSDGTPADQTNKPSDPGLTNAMSEEIVVSFESQKVNGVPTHTQAFIVADVNNSALEIVDVRINGTSYKTHADFKALSFEAIGHVDAAFMNKATGSLANYKSSVIDRYKGKPAMLIRGFTYDFTAKTTVEVSLKSADGKVSVVKTELDSWD